MVDLNESVRLPLMRNGYILLLDVDRLHAGLATVIRS